MGDWKLIVSHGTPNKDEAPRKKAKAKKKFHQDEPVMLFNLAEDPSETTNLATKEPERLAVMKAKLMELLKDAVPSGWNESAW